MLIKDVANTCDTSVAIGLNNQIIWQINQLVPFTLQKFSHPRLVMGDAVIPYLQQPAAIMLTKALDDLNLPSVIKCNSMYRPLPAQVLIWNWYQQGRCGITLAARPGNSNHGNGTAIDVDDAPNYTEVFAKYDWQHPYDNDVPHLEYMQDGLRDVRDIGIKAFQLLWNRANPSEKLAVDGTMGDKTLAAINRSPCEGFYNVGYPRLLRLESPPMLGTSDVGAIQFKLRSLGFNLVANGAYGSETDAAIRKYQESHGIKELGVSYIETLTALGITPK